MVHREKRFFQVGFSRDPQLFLQSSLSPINLTYRYNSDKPKIAMMFTTQIAALSAQLEDCCGAERLSESAFVHIAIAVYTVLSVFTNFIVLIGKSQKKRGLQINMELAQIVFASKHSTFIYTRRQMEYNFESLSSIHSIVTVVWMFTFAT